MKVSKQFRWEAAHRLPRHEGACRHLHGHSYRMRVQLEGPVDERGMVLDFQEIKRVVNPLVEQWDHATLIADDDEALLQAAAALSSKRFVLPYPSTAENLCRYAADYLLREAADGLRAQAVTAVTVRIFETETSFAELTVPVGGGKQPLTND